MKACRHKRSERGFTLVEVLVAMTILAIGLLAISEMQITALQATSFSYSISTTNSLASGVLDEILAWEPNDPRLTSDSTNVVWDLDPAAAGNDVNIAGAGVYNAWYSVKVNQPVQKVATITVRVTGGGVSGFMLGAGQRQRTLIGLKRIQ